MSLPSGPNVPRLDHAHHPCDQSRREGGIVTARVVDIVLASTSRPEGPLESHIDPRRKSAFRPEFGQGVLAVDLGGTRSV